MAMQTSIALRSSCAAPLCPAAQLLRPVHRLLPGRALFTPAVTRQHSRNDNMNLLSCSASEQDQKGSSAGDDVRPDASKAKLADKGADTEVPKLGLGGTIVTWALLIVSIDELHCLRQQNVQNAPYCLLHLLKLYCFACSFCLGAPCSSHFPDHSCQTCNLWIRTAQKSSRNSNGRDGHTNESNRPPSSFVQQSLLHCNLFGVHSTWQIFQVMLYQCSA